MENVHAVEFVGITKRFGSVVANNNVNLYLDKGVVMSLLGENGSGKTTLMNMLAGIYYPDEGHLLIDGKLASIKSPKDAFAYKIGMIHQHFKLVDVFTAAENIVLGLDEEGKLDRKSINKKVAEIAKKYGFDIDPNKKVYEMSVSEKQTVEIIKVLYRGADILILDEPTAVLTPQETKKLFDVIRAMRNDNKSIIIITHKLNEVKEISDVVAIMRKGEHIATVRTSEVSEQQMTEMMVGRTVELNINRTEPKNIKPRLTLANITVRDSEGLKKLDDVGFVAYGGEILGIAGIAGSGQKELLETIAGLRRPESGSIIYTPDGEKPSELVGKTPMEIKNAGVALAFVPEDRLGMGLVGGMGMTDNMLLRYWNKKKGIVVDKSESKQLAENIYKELEVVTPSIDYPVRKLSGGNVQKVLVGREIASSPSVLMSAYAVRGLDINTSYTIYDLMSKQKEMGTAVIFVGEDLDVLLALADRIMVMCDGKISGIVDARTATKEEIGRMMTSLDNEGGR
ncbi:MAG: ABC transporter ATP-binding protein [Erysipelotrichaceae bacterium]|nr:ABC transporter ATP-binding protein [Erysipelotrichaceae bacterium]